MAGTDAIDDLASLQVTQEEATSSEMKEIKPNRFKYKKDEIKFIRELVQDCFEFEYQEHYDFVDKETEEYHDSIAKTLPAHMIRDNKNYIPTKPLIPVLISDKAKAIIQTKSSYKKWDLITNCYGTLKLFKEELVQDHTFVTEFGLILDGVKKGNIWRYVQLSCVPNCRFEQCFVIDNEREYPTFLCSLIAIKDIKVGETLRVEPNHIRGRMGVDYDCNCEYEGCVRNATKLHKCVVSDCTKRGKAFNNAHALKEHMKRFHPPPEPTTFTEVLRAQSEKAKIREKETNKIKCSVDGCDSEFKNTKNLQRHISTVHEKKTEVSCIKCSKTFTRMESLSRHLENNNCTKVKDKKKKVVNRKPTPKDTSEEGIAKKRKTVTKKRKIESDQEEDAENE